MHGERSRGSSLGRKHHREFLVHTTTTRMKSTAESPHPAVCYIERSRYFAEVSEQTRVTFERQHGWRRMVSQWWRAMVWVWPHRTSVVGEAIVSNTKKQQQTEWSCDDLEGYNAIIVQHKETTLKPLWRVWPWVNSLYLSIFCFVKFTLLQARSLPRSQRWIQWISWNQSATRQAKRHESRWWRHYYFSRRKNYECLSLKSEALSSGELQLR